MAARSNIEQHVVERDRGRRIAEAIYGTLVLLAALDYISAEHHGAGETALTIAGGAVVLFIARLYSEGVAQRIAVDSGRGEALAGIVAANWPVVAVAGIPIFLLVIATASSLNLDLALDIASWYCVALLGLSVYAAARLCHERISRRLLFTVATLAAGLLISALDEILT
ncbi:hypothetical protein [Saccharopolyspora spinosa]|uniref:Uncharacterized protein n=1 Tax=Saccharopolyspora spinosa TaxID=60894 RepID=A0A2N3XY48_SACSN|nr:hypothetical protein [Saccharopolyspora spinosa]PKW15578.1 hypothetical protein A8926_3309 [Saccharopolyspora spinosa]